MIQRLKAKIYALVFWQTNLGEYLNKWYDLEIFFRYSFQGNRKFKSEDNYIAFLTKQYHIIEKGLAMPSPRENFGIAKIEELLIVSKEYLKFYPNSNTALLNSIASALKMYLDKNTSLKLEYSDLYTKILDFNENWALNNCGGVKAISSANKQFENFEKFVTSRSSVRNFSDRTVAKEDIEKAVDIAKFAPSVCNRQPWKVHHYQDKSKVKEMLSLQDGNRGFTDSINQLLIITSDVQYFTKLEVNQVYIDGGLFSMNMVLALHSLNIASCCLNLCVPYKREIEIKEKGNIPANERLIMMIGIGYYKEKTLVAMSNRRETGDILITH